MNTFRRFRNSILALASLLFALSLPGYSQNKQTDTFDIYKASFFLPQPLPGGHYSSSISVLYVVTPKDWTLDNITAPMFSYQAKYTLPMGFNLQAGLSSLIISNRIYFGPYWNYQFDRNYVGLGWNVAWNYGKLNQFGFATTLTGWEQQPSITFGHAFTRTANDYKSRSVLDKSTLSFGRRSFTASEANGLINGYSFSASFEQKLYKNRALSLGLKMDYIQYHNYCLACISGKW